jgi:molybdopterin synthase sulfur carrier subunit
MSVKVKVPTPLRRLTNNQREVQVNASNVREVIEGLEESFPGIRERLCDESGEIRQFINFFVDGEDIRFRNGLATEIKDGEAVSIVPAAAGG